ncbi:MAG: hypothetical protein Alpg2KO_28770 [Alphaproteobacteria bacterium]
MPSHTTTTTTGYGGRLKNAIAGFFFGILLVGGAFYLLSWNESRALKTANSIDMAEKVVITVPANEVNPTNDGKLVHFNGLMQTDDTVSDREFGVSRQGVLRLIRDVEMYQWVEDKQTRTRDNVGGGQTTETTYSYSKQWSSSQASMEGPRRSEYQNPSMRFKGDSFVARNVTVGAFTIPRDLHSNLGSPELIPTSDVQLASRWVQQFRSSGEWFSTSSNASDPQVGDYRLRFKLVPESNGSFMAAQNRNTLGQYQTVEDRSVYESEDGLLSAAEMISNMRTQNAMMTWGLRFGGFLMMFIGFAMMLGPIKAVAMLLPFLGNIIGFGTGLIAFVLAFCLSLITIAVAWLAVRPLLGGGLIVLGIAALILPRFIGKKDNVPQPATGDFGTPGRTPPPPPGG